MSVLLGIDIGGSGSRVALRTTDGRRMTLTGGRADISSTGSSVETLAAGLIGTAASAWPDEFARVDAVALGATGLGSLVADPAAFAETLHRVVLDHGERTDDSSAPTTVRVALAIDAVTAHLGALGGDAGAIVALGTGAIAFGSDHHEIWRRIDGWGHLLGDRGGGAWIGLRGLSQAIRTHDGVDAAGGGLLDAARDRYGDPATWPAQLYTRPDRAGVLAEFAPDVVAVASSGDVVARRILDEAGVAAAESTTAALGEDLVPRVAGTGGLLGAVAPIRAAFERELRTARPDVELRTAAGDPLEGALRLASRAAHATVESRPPYLWLSTRR